MFKVITLQRPLSNQPEKLPQSITSFSMSQGSEYEGTQKLNFSDQKQPLYI